MAQSPIFVPSDETELAAAITEVAGTEVSGTEVSGTEASGPIAVRGGASKAPISRPREIALQIDMRGIGGIVDYDPRELVLTVRPGTPLAAVVRTLEEQGQMLAFDPFDHGRLLGGEAGSATIGGVVAAGVAGSRRLSAGGARDHLLGFRAVSGKGQAFVGGGKVVKNVTGYDISKLMAGSWGQLAVLTELTLKTLPAPRARATVALHGLSDVEAGAAMRSALASPTDVAAAAHMSGITALRLEGFGPSVQARSERLCRMLGGELMGEEEAQRFWDGVRHAEPLADAAMLWRINVPPSAFAGVADALARLDGRYFADWAGGLVWAGLPAETEPCAVLAIAGAAGGHAMLIRADSAIRARTAIRQPESEAVTMLSDRVKRAFDPANILDPRRFV